MTTRCVVTNPRPLRGLSEWVPWHREWAAELMFSHFFIGRPIFAAVLSIVITLAGAVAAFNLPVAQYPPISPPSIMVLCTYPGANAHVVADSIAAPMDEPVVVGGYADADQRHSYAFDPASGIGPVRRLIPSAMPCTAAASACPRGVANKTMPANSLASLIASAIFQRRVGYCLR